MPPEASDAGSLLVACLIGDGSALPDDAALRRSPSRTWEQLPAAATYHRVASAAHIATRESAVVPPPVAAALRESYDDALRRHLLFCEVLGSVGGELDAGGVGYVALKGPCSPRPCTRVRICAGTATSTSWFVPPTSRLHSRRSRPTALS